MQVGFNAVYHFTDCPQLVSASSFVMLDPNQKYLPANICAQKPGIRLNFGKLGRLFPDQFAPFVEGHNVRLDAPFRGTLFRFPLRSQDSAAQSELKQTPTTMEDVRTMLESFAASAKNLLLFLKSIRHIEVYELDESGQRVPVLSVQCSDPHSLVPSEPYEAIQQFLRDPTSGTPLAHDDFVRKLLHAGQILPSSLSKRSVSVQVAGQPPRDNTWLVSSCLGGSAAAVSMACGADAKRLKLLPLVEAACCLSEPNIAGRLYVGLPLPVETGLALHINARFALSHNRRELWTGTDMAGDGQTRSKWNLALLDSAAHVAARLLASVAQQVTKR